MASIARTLVALWLALAAQAAAAAPLALVEGVQMPAWVQRGATRIPASAGMELQSGDEVHTGAGARIYVKLPEGSLVRLGENANLRILDIVPERGGLVRGALDVLEGAFRFTTRLLGIDRRRDIQVRIRSVTAGIRGTDLWGRSTEDTQLVCLIEGAIEIQPPGEAALRLEQPLQFYVRERGVSKPVGFVSSEQLARWAAETEIEAGAGAARIGGRWKLTLASVTTQAEALALYDRLREAGYAAVIEPLAGETLVYHLRIRALPNREEAEALARRLAAQFGFATPAVGR